MMANTQEMNNSSINIEVEDTSLDHLPFDQVCSIISTKSEEEIAKFVKRMNRLLDEYEEKKKEAEKENAEEEMKLDIWNAHVRDEIIGIEMKDGDVFVGKSRFSMNTNYTSTEQLKSLFHFDFKLANGVPIGSHIGGDYVDLFTSNIKHIFIMNPIEVADANKYANMAPEFIKRLLPGF
jgi:hypothetical protein